MKQLLFIFFFFVESFLCTALVASERVGASVIPTELLCEYLTNPLGIDVKQPRLSWRLEALDNTKRGQIQKAYQILVASDKNLLILNKADLWDSGVLYSAESVNICYAGKELNKGQVCFWSVRVKDENDVWSAWSEPAFWSMGLFQNDWNAQWIGADGLDTSARKNPVLQRKPDPWLRKDFAIDRIPEKAMIYIASVGYHELYINGEKVGDFVLMPSATNNKIRARYLSYNIKDKLKVGKNVIALWLGTSWSIFPAYITDDKPCAPIAMVQSEFSFPDGQYAQIISDETWRTHPSPNTLLGQWDAHHFAGEEYNALNEVEDWNTVDYDDSHWPQVSVFTPNLVVSADRTEPNLLMKEIKPVGIEEIKPGVFRVDMGVNYTGWFQMEVSGNPGDTIAFQFSERKNANSSYGLHSIFKMGIKRKGVFRNRFNYISGRWVTITGMIEKPTLEQIKGWMIRPCYGRVGGFECDQPLLNDIYNTTLWTFENLSLGNYVVDCPHRERRGYGGDALATTRPALDNYQMGAFYTKWMEDWRDVQQPDGNIPNTAPTYLGGGGPAWGGYCITLPWEMYTQYGDIQILEQSFPVIERWLDFLETKSKNDLLVRWGGKWSFLGDWLWPDAWSERSKMEKQGKALGDTEETLFFNNCHWAYSLKTAAKIARVLNNNKKADQYEMRTKEVRHAIHEQFYDAEDYSYVNGLPAYLAIAIAADIPPEELKGKVWERLRHEIIINRNGHFWGGITAGSFLFFTLLDNNQNDLLYTMISKESFPGWIHMLKHNLGTFFEDWECRGSALHSSYLYVGSWFTEMLGGIRRPYAGYKQFVIEPWINQKHGPQRVYSHHDSLYGTIESNWSKKNGQLTLELSVPANTSAILNLHGIHATTIRERGMELSKTSGISINFQKSALTSLRLTAGNYKFTAEMLLE